MIKQYVYVIVIARGRGFTAVNEPSPRVKPEDKVCYVAIKATRINYASTIALTIA